jgi:penicillin-binding protein 1A
MLKKLLIALSILLVVAAGAVALGATWAYHYFTRDLPNIETVNDYRPPAVSSIYARDGTLVAEFFEERRYPVKLQDVPLIIRQAFLASEDENFYRHQGIDPVSILRAIYKNITAGGAKQGASTITQQVVKNLLLTPERKLERKVKEAILSYRLEKRLTKDEILEIYLNQIFLGNNAYGILAASRAYFHKELRDVTVAEAAILAGLPQAPSRYSPVLHPERAKRRQRYVLGQMVKAGFITKQRADEAEREKIRYYPPEFQNIYRAPYYLTEIRRVFGEKWPDYNIDRDGLTIHTALNLNADTYGTAALRKGLREVDKRRGWRGPLGTVADLSRETFKKSYPVAGDELVPGEIYPALVLEISRAAGTAKVDLGKLQGIVSLKDAGWAKKKLAQNDAVSSCKPEEVLRPGDVIEVSRPAGEATTQQPRAPGSIDGLILDQTPDIEGALTLIEPDSGKVVAAIGGYSYQKSVFNRVTQALRQPGSTFKPVVYLGAIDGYKYTPSTIVYDTPRTFRVGDQFWTPANFDKSFLGPITLRTALEKSRNLVSADIVSKIGVSSVIKYAKLLGIESPLGRNLSLALGSSEVTVLEMARSYGVFAAKGVLFDSVFITKIVDRDGVVLYDYDQNEKLTSAKPAISEASAFIMANMLKGVIDNGTGYRIKPIGRPVAGKTGTSNDQMDAWFVGFTPQWSCAVWVGFDQKKKIGEKETGGVVAAPIWLYFMSDFLAYQDKREYAAQVEQARADADRLGLPYHEPDPVTALDFSVPDGVDPFWVNKQSGLISEPEAPGAIYEYFIRGTEPVRSGTQELRKSYLEDPEM